MASTLAQQLAQLQVVKGPQAERHAHGKLSLLFDYQKAADVSAEQLLGLAQQGEQSCSSAATDIPEQRAIMRFEQRSAAKKKLNLLEEAINMEMPCNVLLVCILQAWRPCARQTKDFPPSRTAFSVVLPCHYPVIN